MKKLWRSVALLFAVCMLLSLCAASAGAVAWLDPEAYCTLTVNIPQNYEEKLSEVPLEVLLYRLANIDGNGTLLAITEGPFGGLGDDNGLLTGVDQPEELAKTALALSMYEEPSVGRVGEPIWDLEPGLFLMVVRGEGCDLDYCTDENEVPYATRVETENGTYEFSPSIVLLPQPSYDGEGNVIDWDYEPSIFLKPKTESSEETTEAPPPEEPGVILPETGGMGTAVYYIAGSGLVAIGLFLFAVRRRRDDA